MFSPLWQRQRRLVPVHRMRSRIDVAIIGAVATFLLTLSLGQWQLRRADEKLTLQQQWEEALRAEPAVVSASTVGSIGAQLPVRVRLSGQWLHEREVWLQNRTLNGRSGFHVLTPLRVNDGPIVLVDRGFAPRDPRNIGHLPPIERPTGPVTVEAVAVAHPSRVLQLGNEPTPISGRPWVWQNLDRNAFEQGSGLKVAHWIARQLERPAGGLELDTPRSAADVDRHRGYAFQWFALAALTALLTGFLSLRALKRRPSVAES